MPKKGMSRPEYTHVKQRNDVPPVPEIHGKAKHSKVKANPIIAGTDPPYLKVYHSRPHSLEEKEISNAYPVIDNDLARDNIENDIPAADLQDL